MASEDNWSKQVDRIASDNQSGASDIAQRSAKALIAYADQEQPRSVAEIARSVTDIAARLVARHPTMAGLLRILNDVLQGITEVETPRLGLDQIRRISNEHIAWVEQATVLVVERALEALPREGAIVTLSYSSAVARVLLASRHRGSRHRVICLESRPLLEGREMANFLGKNGIEVTLAIDLAAGTMLNDASLFVIGADSLTANGVINKLGTAMVALSARSRGIPCLVIGDSSKIWPSAAPVPKFVEHNPDEIWPRPPRVVEISNVYFDITPWELISTLMTERGVATASQVIESALHLGIHPNLKGVLGQLK